MVFFDEQQISLVAARKSVDEDEGELGWALERQIRLIMRIKINSCNASEMESNGE